MASRKSTTPTAPEQTPIKSGVYAIRCLANGKVYVGSSGNIKNRWLCHLSHLRCGRHANIHLQRAWDKHGPSAFVFDVLEISGVAGLLEAEQRHLDAARQAGPSLVFNMNPVAGSSPGRHCSDEAKAKIGAKNSGRIFTAEHRAKISRGLSGKKHDPATNAKIAAAHKGKPWSPERKAILSAALKNRRKVEFSPERKAKHAAMCRARNQSPEQKAKVAAVRASLSPEQVSEIRLLLSEGATKKEIGKRLGCSPTTIANIEAGRTAIYASM